MLEALSRNNTNSWILTDVYSGINNLNIPRGCVREAACQKRQSSAPQRISHDTR